jgi:hypothetical protein
VLSAIEADVIRDAATALPAATITIDNPHANGVMVRRMPARLREFKDTIAPFDCSLGRAQYLRFARRAV